MRDTLILIALALAAAVVGVFVYFMSGANRGAPASSASLAMAPGTPVAFTTLATGTHASVTKPTNYLITSADELRTLWAMTDANSMVPTVDFSKDAVIAVFAGTEPTAGFSIAIAQVRDTAARTVSIVLTEPGGSCIVAQSETAPYEIVRVPRTALPLTHTLTTETTSCLQ